MSRETVNIVKDCALESGGRLAFLEGIAHYTNDETGLARVSLSSLMVVTRLKERHLRNLRDELVAATTGFGVLIEVEPVARGRKRRGDPASGAGVYTLNTRRLAPVAAAVRQGRRAIFAGAGKAMEKAGLIGLPASFENSFALMAAVRDAVEDERRQAAYLSEPKREAELAAHVGAIDGQIAVLKAVAEAEIGAENAALIAGFSAQQSGTDCRIKGVNSALEEPNSAIGDDSPPYPPYKDIPQGEPSPRATRAKGGKSAKRDCGLLQGAIAAAMLRGKVVSWLEGAIGVIEGSVLVIHAPDRLAADRLRGEHHAETRQLAKALRLETVRVEG